MVEEGGTIIELYSYSLQEQEAFAYVREYMQLIQGEIDALVNDPESRERFVLAGLFLTYRACNHQGEPMTTDASRTHLSAIHANRLANFKVLIGKEIAGADDYLEKIGMSKWMFVVPWPRLGVRLAQFVLRGL